MKYGHNSAQFTGWPDKRMRSDADDDAPFLLQGDYPFANPGPVLPPPAELRYFDTYLSATEPSEDGAMSGGLISNYADDLVCAPVRGTGPVHRNGDRITVTSWHLKGSLSLGAISNGTKPPFGRSVFIALIRDSAPNGVLPTAPDVYVNPSASPDALMHILRNPLRGKRFEVLRTGTYDLSPTSCNVWDAVAPDSTANPGRMVNFEFFVPLNRDVRFHAPISSILHIIENCFHVIAFCTPHYAVGLENAPRVYMTYSSRIRFFSHA